MNLTKPQQLWVNALRSGEYKQTTEQLNDGDGGFCCLGVLCDLYEKETGNTFTKNEDGVYTYGEIRELGLALEYDYDAVKKWAGLKSVNGEFRETDDDENTCLAELNDDGYSFFDIANVIEKEADKLFVKESNDE